MVWLKFVDEFCILINGPHGLGGGRPTGILHATKFGIESGGELHFFLNLCCVEQFLKRHITALGIFLKQCVLLGLLSRLLGHLIFLSPLW